MTGIEFFASTDLQQVQQELEKGAYDAFWVIDYGQDVPPLDKAFVDVLKSQTDNGMGLILNTENDPFFKMSNQILDVLKPEWNIHITGNDLGGNTISREEGSIGKLKDHPISSGIYHNISEGATISYVEKKNSAIDSVLDKEYFYEVVQNSSGNISVSSIEEPLTKTSGIRKNTPKNKANEPVLRVVLHGGFTSLFRSEFMELDPLTNQWVWDSKLSPATPMFFENITCYAIGE
jgi:hypothetical protein